MWQWRKLGLAEQKSPVLASKNNEQNAKDPTAQQWAAPAATCLERPAANLFHK